MSAINKDDLLKDQSKPDDWKMPDGRQMTWQALQAMGCTSGDVGDRMREFYFDPDPNAFQNFSLKGVEVIQDHKVSSANEEHVEEQRHEQTQFDENKRLEEQRLIEQRRLEEQRQQEAWQEKKDAEEKFAAERRPQEEAANARIMGLPLGLAGFGMTLGLGVDALNAVGGMVSPSVNAMNDPMMVSSNNGGGLLAMARGALNIAGPGNDKDFLLKGPNQTASFTPGAPAPEVDPDSPFRPSAPTRKIGMGMAGPGLTPPGMNA